MLVVHSQAGTLLVSWASAKHSHIDRKMRYLEHKKNRPRCVAIEYIILLFGDYYRSVFVVHDYSLVFLDIINLDAVVVVFDIADAGIG